MSTHEQITNNPTSAVRNTGGRNGPQGLEEPMSDEILREMCDKNYHQLLPLIAEKMQKEKEQKDKLNAVKARLIYGEESGIKIRSREESHYSESKTPTARTEPRRRHGDRYSRSPSPHASVFKRLKKNRSPSPQPRPRKEGGVFNRLGRKEPATSARSDGRRRSPQAKRTEIETRRRQQKQTPSRTASQYSESEDSEGGHWKSKSRRQRSNTYEDDLSQPWTCEERNPFTPRIRHFSLPRTRMPSHVKTYDGSGDPEDHLKLFQSRSQEHDQVSNILLTIPSVKYPSETRPIGQERIKGCWVVIRKRITANNTINFQYILYNHQVMALATRSGTSNNEDGGVNERLRSLEESLAQITRAMQDMVTINQMGNGDDVKGWIFRCEQFFSIDDIPEKNFIRLNGENVSWDVYETGILQSRVDISEEHAVSFYLGGLPAEIEMGVRMFGPKTLVDAYRLTNYQEDTLEAVKKKSKTTMNFSGGRFGSGMGQGSNSKPPLLSLPAPNTSWKSTVSPGHKCSGQLYSIVVLADDEEEYFEAEEGGEELMTPDEIPQISLNVLNGANTFQTMRVTEKVGKHELHILIDCGSSDNFLDVNVAKRVGCPVTSTCPLAVTVGGNKQLISDSECKNFEWQLQGETLI
ncbi:hypothetical protein Tco_1401134 [Tanacetum coccineum]